ncbi:MAG: hypothetical protein J0M08_12025 [Bacteroidetes bacterium]|nr:hypothetical protein [Bacteroidota bacterium]
MKQSQEELKKIITKANTLKVVEKQPESKLQFVHEQKTLFTGKLNNYQVLGNLSSDLSCLPITLLIEMPQTLQRERYKIDLYEKVQVTNLAATISAQFFQDEQLLLEELQELTSALENYRETTWATIQGSIKTHPAAIAPKENKKEILDFLSAPNLFERIDKLLEQAGVVGEELNRKLLFLIALSYKTKVPMHAAIEDEEDNNLLNTIARCFPSDEVVHISRATAKSFYYYNHNQLDGKLLVVTGFLEFHKEAQQAFVSLQKNGELHTSLTYKNRNGQLASTIKHVSGSFASLVASDSPFGKKTPVGFLVHKDKPSVNRANAVNNFVSRSRTIHSPAAEEARIFLQRCTNQLQKVEIHNPFILNADIPAENSIKQIALEMLDSLVHVVAYLHQYQRKKNSNGIVQVTEQDIILAIELVTDWCYQEQDGLGSHVYLLFEALKNYVRKTAPDNPSNYSFMQREIRSALNVSKSKCDRIFSVLVERDFLVITGGNKNKGYCYKISTWEVCLYEIKQIKQQLMSCYNLPNFPP